MQTNPTTTGPATQTTHPPALDDNRTPYRVTFTETTYRTLDVLARDEQEAEDIASANTEYALEGECIGFEVAKTRECFARDFCPINE